MRQLIFINYEYPIRSALNSLAREMLPDTLPHYFINTHWDQISLHWYPLDFSKYSWVITLKLNPVEVIVYFPDQSSGADYSAELEVCNRVGNWLSVHKDDPEFVEECNDD